MALSRVTTWVSGQVLTAAALNAEFNNILSNPISLISPTTGNINMNGNQITNLVLEKLGADPAAGTAGRVFFNTASTLVKIDTGASIITVGPLTATGAVKPVGSYVRGLTGTLSTNQAQFAANYYAMQTTGQTDTFMVSATSAYTINTRTTWTAAANGRDSVAAVASTTLYFYAISTGQGSTAPQGICSTNGPLVGPTLPTNYNSYAFLSATVYTTATSSIDSNLNHHVKGSWSYLDTAYKVVNAAGDTTEAAVPLTSAVPTAISDRVKVALWACGGQVDGAGTIIIDHKLRVVSGSDYHVTRASASGLPIGTNIYPVNDQVECPVISSGSPLYYLSPVTNGSNQILTLYVQGWHNPNGDG